jgi:hypothetical protein
VGDQKLKRVDAVESKHTQKSDLTEENLKNKREVTAKRMN